MSAALKSFPVNLEPVEYDTLQRVAYIVGGGAAMALAEYERLKAEGRNPSLWLDRKRSDWVVKHNESTVEKPE